MDDIGEPTIITRVPVREAGRPRKREVVMMEVGDWVICLGERGRQS